MFSAPGVGWHHHQRRLLGLSHRHRWSYTLLFHRMAQGLLEDLYRGRDTIFLISYRHLTRVCYGLGIGTKISVKELGEESPVLRFGIGTYHRTLMLTILLTHETTEQNPMNSTSGQLSITHSGILGNDSNLHQIGALDTCTQSFDLIVPRSIFGTESYRNQQQPTNGNDSYDVMFSHIFSMMRLAS